MAITGLVIRSHQLRTVDVPPGTIMLQRLQESQRPARFNLWPRRTTNLASDATGFCPRAIMLRDDISAWVAPPMPNSSSRFQRLAVQLLAVLAPVSGR